MADAVGGAAPPRDGVPGPGLRHGAFAVDAVGGAAPVVEVPPLSTPPATQPSSSLIPEEVRAPAPFGASADEA